MDKSEFGKLEAEIKPNIKQYLIEGLMGIFALAVTVLFHDYLSNFSWKGLPIVGVISVVGILMVLVAFYKFFKHRSSEDKIELYESGIKFNDFIAEYKDFKISYNRGFIGRYLVLHNNIEQSVFKYPISSNDLKLITAKLSK